MTPSLYIPKAVLIAKRLFDLLCASLGLILLCPLFPILSLLIKWDSPGPIIFKQIRIGQALEDRTTFFWMYKFRSMAQDAESKTGPVWATKNDPRVTLIGKFLRKTRLDELPQLFNVFKGDMSLIGPRPERPSMYPKLEKAIPFFSERTFGLRPGITGLAQVLQGYTETIEEARDKVGYDHAYALSLSTLHNWFFTDLTILYKTVHVVIFGKGQ